MKKFLLGFAIAVIALWIWLNQNGSLSAPVTEASTNSSQLNLPQSDVVPVQVVSNDDPAQVQVTSGQSGTTLSQGTIPVQVDGGGTSELEPTKMGMNIASSQGNPISMIFRPEIQYWMTAIQKWAVAAGLDPNLVATVMQIESCGDPKALSRAGAMGLFQVMPQFFNGGDDSYSPDTNATRGLAHLKQSLDAAGGDVRLALAGYNGGITVIGQPESSWLLETQRYVYWGSGIYAEAVSNAHRSLRLQEWMDAGGISLCRQARHRLGISP